MNRTLALLSCSAVNKTGPAQRCVSNEHRQPPPPCLTLCHPQTPTRNLTSGQSQDLPESLLIPLLLTPFLHFFHFSSYLFFWLFGVSLYSLLVCVCVRVYAHVCVFVFCCTGPGWTACLPLASLVPNAWAVRLFCFINCNEYNVLVSRRSTKDN